MLVSEKTWSTNQTTKDHMQTLNNRVTTQFIRQNPVCAPVTQPLIIQHKIKLWINLNIDPQTKHAVAKLGG